MSHQWNAPLDEWIPPIDLAVETGVTLPGPGGGIPGEGSGRSAHQRHLAGEVACLRNTLDRLLHALEEEGYSVDRYCRLDEAGRSTPIWSALEQAWVATGRGPRYVLRSSKGCREEAADFPSRQAALEAAIEALEMCDGYPSSIELEGGSRLMDRTEILRVWGERHDPG